MIEQGIETAERKNIKIYKWQIVLDGRGRLRY